MKNNDKTQKTESTVFCDPDRGENSKVKKRSKGKTATVILLTLFLIFVIIPVIIWLFIKGSENQSNTRYVPPISSRIENTEADEKAKALFAAKNPYIGDNSADAEILSLLDIANNCGRFTIELKTDAEPYRITMCFSETRDISIGEWFENTMVKYSCVILALIENADEVGWSYPADETGDTGGYFTREDAQKLLNVPVEYYSESAEGIQLLLTELGLDE